MRLNLLFFPTCCLLVACGQKGPLYLPDDYERPEYQQQITKTFDTVEDIVVQTLDRMVGDATTDARGETRSDATTDTTVNGVPNGIDTAQDITPESADGDDPADAPAETESAR